MIGQGVLRECLSAPDVDSVLVAGRTPLGQTHAKLTEVLRPDLLQWTDVEPQLTGIDACYYCLGVSSAGMSEADYRRVTVDFAVALATSLKRVSPNATFCFVTGGGSGTTKSMWARVKGEAEQALRGFGFKQLFLFRPAYIQPMDGIVSKTTSYRLGYAVVAPLYPLWKLLMPNQVSSTRQMGRAMLQVTRKGFAKEILDTADINLAAG